jgi:hypothetical protein
MDQAVLTLNQSEQSFPQHPTSVNCQAMHIHSVLTGLNSVSRHLFSISLVLLWNFSLFTIVQ